MPDMLDQGSAWLEEQRHEHMTRMVMYRRGDATVELAATIGRTVFETTDDFGVVQKTESRDYLVRAHDLMLAGQATLPMRGDRILEAQDGQVFTYEVMPAASGGDTFRFSDPYRRTIRIHTKLVGTEAPGTAL